MARQKSDSPQKAALREMMSNYLKENDVRIKNGTDVNSIMRDMMSVILALPWCWYEELPHDLATLKSIVQNGQKAEGCEGITHTGKVPYLTYSEDSLYDEVKEQFPEVYDTTVTYGGEEYARVRGR